VRALFLAVLFWWAACAIAQAPPPISVTVERFDVVGDNPLSPAVTEQALAPFLGE
jgi:hypothetical protein